MSGKFKVPVELGDETVENGTVTVFADGGHLAIQTEEEAHTILDDRTVLGTLASQDADSVTITGGTISGITDIAVADGGTGASTAAGAVTNLGAVPTSRTVNGKSLGANITLTPDDIGALPDTTTYGASLAANGRDISLVDQNGDTLATVQTQDISGKLDKQVTYSAAGVVSRFFHESDGGGYQLTDSNDDSIAFIGGNADTSSPIKLETYAKTVADDIGTRIIQTLEKVYYTKDNDDSSYGDGDEVAVISDIPTALSSLTNDGNYVVDASYVHTDSNFTAMEKSKLAGLDDNHFKGSYPSLDALETAHPTASDGDYAYVGVEGTPAVMYLWDVTDEEWVQGGSPAGETPASVKEKYESNPDTNAFTDDDVALIGTIGDVADLETTSKDTTVDAINELVGTFSSYVPTTRTVNNKSLSANVTLSNSDIGSEPAVTAGTTAQFWRGDKAWTDFGTTARAALLTGLSTATKTAITATDTIIVALGKLQAQITSSGFTNPMTAPYDIIYSKDDLGTPERLPIGDDNTFLKSEFTPSGTPQLGYISKTNTSPSINAISYGNGRYYYVGDNVRGYIYPTSSVSFNNSTNPYPLRGVCVGLSIGSMNAIVACGPEGKIATSSNLSFTTLSSVSSGTTNDLNSIANKKNTFVAVGDGGTIVTSNNISSGFSPVTSGTTHDLHRVRVINGMFIAVGDNCILSSPDGVSWTSADNVYGNPDITDIAYDSNSGKYLCTAWDGSSGVVFAMQDIAHYYINVYLTVSNTPLMTIAVVDGRVVVAGSGAYAALGQYDELSQYYTFTALQPGVTNDINDMVWTDSFIGAIVCSGGVVGFNKFSGGATNVLKYKPIPVVTNDWIPSDKYIDITYGASGDMYTAPANGWMYAKCTASNTNAYITAEIILSAETSVGVYGSGAITYSSGRSLFLLFPVAAGYNFKMWNSNLTVNIFRFIYAKGAL